MQPPSEVSERLDPALVKLILILVVGAVAPSLDSTIVNVALAALGKGLHTTVATSQWTITGYLLTGAMAMPVSGWATERFGGKRVWLVSLAAFLVGSALSGLAWSMSSLIVFRLVQGVGAGLMLPVVVTLLVEAAGPKRLGRMMGVATLPMIVAPLFGPVAGGLIVDGLGWRWIFFVNVPICLAAIALAWRGVAPSPTTRAPRPLDIIGLALLSPALAAIVYGLAQVTGPVGFTSARALVPLLAGVALVVLFSVHTVSRREAPLINLRLMAIPSYAAAMIVLFLSGLSVYGPLILVALLFQEVLGKSALVAGLLLAAQGVGSLLPRTVTGKLTDRIGPRYIVVAGLALTVVGTLAFTHAGTATSLWLLVASLLVRGIGITAVTIAVVAGAFQGVAPPDVPDASSTTRIVLQVGGSFGSAVLAVILAQEMAGKVAVVAAARSLAFGAAFWWAIGFAAITLLPALMLPSWRTKAT